MEDMVKVLSQKMKQVADQSVDKDRSSTHQEPPMPQEVNNTKHAFTGG